MNNEQLRPEESYEYLDSPAAVQISLQVSGTGTG